jgi:hypothetical protein
MLLLQYSETNVMHFLFNLLRIKGLLMFRVSLAAHLQDAHRRPTPILVQPTDITRAQYTECRLCVIQVYLLVVLDGVHLLI